MITKSKDFVFCIDTKSLQKDTRIYDYISFFQQGFIGFHLSSVMDNSKQKFTPNTFTALGLNPYILVL